MKMVRFKNEKGRDISSHNLPSHLSLSLELRWLIEEGELWILRWTIMRERARDDRWDKWDMVDCVREDQIIKIHFSLNQYLRDVIFPIEWWYLVREEEEEEMMVVDEMGLRDGWWWSLREEEDGWKERSGSSFTIQVRERERRREIRKEKIDEIIKKWKKRKDIIYLKKLKTQFFPFPPPFSSSWRFFISSLVLLLLVGFSLEWSKAISRLLKVKSKSILDNSLMSSRDGALWKEEGGDGKEEEEGWWGGWNSSLDLFWEVVVWSSSFIDPSSSSSCLLNDSLSFSFWMVVAVLLFLMKLSGFHQGLTSPQVSSLFWFSIFQDIFIHEAKKWCKQFQHTIKIDHSLFFFV